ncbi:MAG: restriction endonuclease subunit S [Candidatus Rokubacteria bacterium]|nr:restriction endonuclease subunit S [Candidatus Rokubacteria bacterium]
MSWVEKRLDELGYVSRGRSRHRPRDAAHLYGGPYPFVQTGDVKHTDLYITEYSQTYSEAGLAQSRLWPRGTLCITIAANIADTAILGIDACFPDSIIGFIADDSKCDVRFVKYKLDVIKAQYQQVSQGATQDNLSQEKLLSFPLRVPKDAAVQRQIAEILCSYDDLIENNRRRMALLEEAARQLYREWFVRLRFPGHEHTRITHGVPEGWERKPIGEVATLNYGKALKEENRLEGATPVYGSSGVVGSHNEALVTGPGIVVGRKGNVGSVFWSDTPFWPIDTVYFVSPEESSLFLYHCLKNVAFQSSDVAVPGLNRTYAHSLKILVPSRTLRAEFEEAVTPMFEQLARLRTMNERLRAARDLLLPRLMSGEIAV